MEQRKDWETPELQLYGSVESLTLLKFEGGFDGIQIQLDGGDIVSGS